MGVFCYFDKLKDSKISLLDFINLNLIKIEKIHLIIDNKKDIFTYNKEDLRDFFNYKIINLEPENNYFIKINIEKI